MSNKKNRSAKNKPGGTRKTLSAEPSGLTTLLDELRQLSFPSAFRIGLPPSTQTVANPESEAEVVAPPVRPPSPPVAPPIHPSALAEVATCLWYLKTRHFKREWKDEDTTDNDPRTRRTLGRLNKGIDALKKCGIEVEDPTGKRYATGSEAMMKPLDFAQTEGLTYEKVTETVSPLIYWQDRIIQRAEVFVAVPMPNAPAAQEAPAAVAASETALTPTTLTTNADQTTGEQP